jgi:tetratricopeptide (TPR) repeat protein
MPLLNDVMPLGVPETALSGQIVGAARASALHVLLREILARTAQAAPVMLIADDFHWFDGASASALATVAGDLRNVLVLAAARPLDATAPAEVAGLVHHPDALRLELDALPRATIGRLICDKLGAGMVAEELADFVYERSGGNPFHAEELALTLKTSALIQVRGDCVVLASGVEPAGLEALPDSLRGVIMGRVDAFGAAEQLALKIASVIGREFSVLMLRDLHPDGHAQDMDALIEGLLREDVVRPAMAGTRGEFVFKHAILQGVVYDLLPFALRRELHASAALWIERNEARNLEPFYSELALHWERGGGESRAVDYLEKAGQLALARYANREAIRHVRRAQQLAQRERLAVEDARAARWEAMLGDAHHEMFEYGPAARHFGRGLALARRPVPQGTARLAAGILAQTFSQLAARLGPARTAARAPEAAHMRWASHIHERLAEIAYFDNRPLELLHATLASLNLAERSGSVREIVDGCAALSIGLQQAGAAALSRYYNRRSLEVAESSGSLSDVAYAHLVNSVYQAAQGKWDRLRASHQRAAALYRQLGAAVRWHQTQSVLYTSLAIRGLFEEASGELAAARGALQRDTPAQVRSWVSAAETVVALAGGGCVVQLVRELEEVQQGGLHRADLVQCKGLAARAQLSLGRMDEALRAADAALALLQDGIPTAWHVTPGLAGTVEVYLAACEADEASHVLERRADQACRLLRRYSRTTPISAPRAAFLAGRHALLRGNAERAHSLWRRAAGAALTLEMPWDRELALRALEAARPSVRQAERH